MRTEKLTKSDPPLKGLGFNINFSFDMLYIQINVMSIVYLKNLRKFEMKYYDNLKKIREQKQKSQKQIADILNTTQQQYHLYESGKRKLPIDGLIILCNYYNISADYILGLSDFTDIRQ